MSFQITRFTSSSTEVKGGRSQQIEINTRLLYRYTCICVPPWERLLLHGLPSCSLFHTSVRLFHTYENLLQQQFCELKLRRMKSTKTSTHSDYCYYCNYNRVHLQTSAAVENKYSYPSLPKCFLLLFIY